MTLDIFLPDMQGWRILERLKADLSTRHIPVCVVSTDDSRERALDSGAIGFIAKPLSRATWSTTRSSGCASSSSRAAKQVLLLMPDGAARRRDRRAPGAPRTCDVLVAGRPRRRCGMLRDEPGRLPGDRRGSGDLEPAGRAGHARAQPVTQQLPIVLYRRRTTGALGALEAPSDGCSRCARRARAERLLDYVYFFLHRSAAAHVGRTSASALEELHSSSRILEGRKALIVDDDMRNIFALATVLDEQGMEIVSANNGRDAITHGGERPDIDIVLMDIMMPEMDGIATMQEIRKLPSGRDLPIIAVTAKAMKGDREKCIEAGAWDYLSKPVDRVHLLAVLRGWLHR